MNPIDAQALRLRSHTLIPGGCHTYAKGDDQYPASAPPFIARGSGAHVWDLDDREYLEFGMGNRAVTLGHAYPPVVAAVQRELERGVNFPRPSPLEVECAETLLGLIDGAEMVKFGKNGSDVTSAAVRLARACTGRDRIAVCADHPFFSIDDWFMATTPVCAGIPGATRALTSTFRYNDIGSVAALFRDHPGEIAAIILEPAKYEEPCDGFLQAALDLCHDHGALFILDEIITGFRWDKGGAQKIYGITPDLSTFGKGMANGFSVSALAGKRRYMERGGLYHEQERVFLLSLTHGGETHALAAAIETMRTYEREPVVETLTRLGCLLHEGLTTVIHRHGLQEHFVIEGRPGCMIWGARDAQGLPSQAFRTLFLQETIARGVIMPSLVLCYSHTEADIEKAITAVDGALGVYARALSDGVEGHLQGPPSKSVYRRFN